MGWQILYELRGLHRSYRNWQRLPEAKHISRRISDAEIAHAIRPVGNGNGDGNACSHQPRVIVVDSIDMQVQPADASWFGIGTAGKRQFDLITTDGRQFSGLSPFPSQGKTELVEIERQGGRQVFGSKEGETE